MPIIKFKCWPMHTTKPEDIRAVEVERETDQSVWVNGKRCAKQCEYAVFFDDWEAARAACVAWAERKAAHHEYELNALLQRAEKLRAFTPPAA